MSILGLGGAFIYLLLEIRFLKGLASILDLGGAFIYLLASFCTTSDHFWERQLSSWVLTRKRLRQTEML